LCLTGSDARHADELGRAAAFAYDSMNRLSFVRDPLGTTWSNAYDRMGNVVSHLPSYSAADTFQHDALGRVTQMSSTAGSFACTYNVANLATWQAFDDRRTNSYVYDAAFRLTNAATAQSSTLPYFQSSSAYAYDQVGNPTSVQTSISNQQSTINNLFDLAGQRTSSCLQISSPQSAISNWYQYDALGRLASLTNKFLTATYLYDEAGNITQKVVKAVGSTTSVVSRYQYDALDRLTNLASRIQYPGANAPVDSFAYTYEPSRSLIAGIHA